MTPSAPPTLRERVLLGGAQLAARQGASIVLRVGGVVALTALIGPGDFGRYAGALAIATLLALVAQAGVDVFLLRRREEPGRALEDQAFSLLVVTGATFTVVGLLAAETVGRSLLDPGFIAPLQALLLTLPLTVLAVPARCRLERALAFRSFALVELTGELLFYAVAIGLAARGLGTWAPVIAFAALQAWLLVGWARAARWRPGWRWSRPLLAEIVRYGMGSSAATWALRSQDLINPVVVGGFLGPAAVGQVALALRVLETLSLVKAATTRLGIVALAKVQAEPHRLQRVHAEAMVLQLLGVGPLLAAFALLSPVVVPAALGPEWAPVADVFPPLALATLLGTLFNMHTAALEVVGRTLAVARMRVLKIGLFAAAAVVLVPALGLVGFGLAFLAKSIGFVIAHRDVRALFAPRYREALPWLVALVPPLAGPWVAWPLTPLLLVPTAAVLAAPAMRAQLLGYGRAVRSVLVRRQVA